MTEPGGWGGNLKGGGDPGAAPSLHAQHCLYHLYVHLKGEVHLLSHHTKCDRKMPNDGR
jgi:hypothetical protein